MSFDFLLSSKRSIVSSQCILHLPFKFVRPTYHSLGKKKKNPLIKSSEHSIFISDGQRYVTKAFPQAIPENPKFGSLVKVFPNSMALILKCFQK